MYRKSNQPELTPENFELPKETKLLADNRWVIMSKKDTVGESNLQVIKRNIRASYQCINSRDFNQVIHGKSDIIKEIKKE